MQTGAFEIEGDVIRALYVVRNPDKLRHLAPTRHESGTEMNEHLLIRVAPMPRASDIGRDHEGEQVATRVSTYDFDTAE